MEDRSWMYSFNDRDILNCYDRVNRFIEVAAQNALHWSEETIYCPCKICKNEAMYPSNERDTIRFHLLKNGFVKNYCVWTKHGEIGDNPAEDSYVSHDVQQAQRGCDYTSDITHDVDQHDDPHDFDIEELMRNVAPEVLLENTTKGYDNFEALDKASKDLLYGENLGCDKEYSVLYTTLELMKLKASNGWSDTSFSELLNFLKKVFSKPNGLPSDTYQAKKILCPLTLEVQKIHTCPNYCILNRKEYESLDCCPTCNTSRYKQVTEDGPRKKNKMLQKRKRNVTTVQGEDTTERKVPALVMWYLPVTDRLKRMFSNPRDAKLLIWHFNKRKMDGKLRHPADARQ